MSAVVPSSADESFGRRLRRERERRQIALASIAENSKIKVSLFEELERDDTSHWPSGVFRRSFIRAYAEAIGLDADETAREFHERFPDPNDPDKRFAEAADGDKAASPALRTSAPGSRSALRLTLADTGGSFSAGKLLASLRSRCVAIAYDTIIIVTLALTIYLVLGTIWMPLCLALAGYYAGGILLLGNTPGVCLSATNTAWTPPPPTPRTADEPPSAHRRLRSASA